MKPALVGEIPIPGTEWTMVTGPDACFPAYQMAMRGPVAIDIETFGLGADSWRIKCVVISDGETVAVLDPRDPTQNAAIKDATEQASTIYMWNSPFDAPILVNNNLLRVDDLPKIVDSLIHARLANPDPFVSKGLEDVAARMKVHSKGTPISQTFKELGLSKKDGFHKFDIDRADYLFGAALDGIVTYKLAPIMREEARKRLVTNPYQKFRTPNIDALIDREQIVNRVMLRRACLGIRVDFDFAAAYRKENQGRIDELDVQLKALGIKPGDGGSLLKWMDDEGLIGEDHPRTPTGRLQATAAVLEGVDHPLARIFVESKQKTKLDRDYLAKMEDLSKPTGGRIHPQTNIFAAVTGRSSMSNPPLQQIPPAARGIFLPDEGRQFVSIDYSQVEPYVAACIAGDIPVLRGYESGESDLYTDLAEFAAARGNIHPRKVWKVVLLAQMYGEGLGKLTRDLELDPGPLIQLENGEFRHTYDEARSLREQVFEVMPATGKMLDNIKDAAKRNRCVPTLSGRVVPVPVYVNKETGEKTDVAGYKGMNYVVQGSSYDLLASAIVRCHEEGYGEAIYLSVHDELVVDAEAAPDIQRIMELPNPDLTRLAGRTPRVRTEMGEPVERWTK